MHPTVEAARVAGLLYLLMGIPAAFSMMYVPGTLIVPGDAAATANNILSRRRFSVWANRFCPSRF